MNKLLGSISEKIMGTMAKDIEPSAQMILKAQETWLMVFLGVLGDPQNGMRIGFVDQSWVLATGEGDSYEILCRHEDWQSFMELAAEYSDYAEE